MNFWIGLLIAILCVIVVWIYSVDEIKEVAKQEKKRLLREKNKLLHRQRIKERLKTLLYKRYHWRLQLGYTALLLSFAGLTVFTSYVMKAGYDFQGLATGAGVLELAILVIAIYSIKKPVEFNYILKQWAPFLKKKVFRKDINIEAEIKETEREIADIDQDVYVLDQIIAAV